MLYTLLITREFNGLRFFCRLLFEVDRMDFLFQVIRGLPQVGTEVQNGRIKGILVPFGLIFRRPVGWQKSSG